MKQRLRDLEARELWVAARIDELMDDWRFTAKAKKEWFDDDTGALCTEFILFRAKQTAEREHANLMSDLEDERINQHRGHHEF